MQRTIFIVVFTLAVISILVAAYLLSTWEPQDAHAIQETIFYVILNLVTIYLVWLTYQETKRATNLLELTGQQQVNVTLFTSLLDTINTFRTSLDSFSFANRHGPQAFDEISSQSVLASLPSATDPDQLFVAKVTVFHLLNRWSSLTAYIQISSLEEEPKKVLLQELFSIYDTYFVRLDLLFQALRPLIREEERLFDALQHARTTFENLRIHRAEHR